MSPQSRCQNCSSIQILTDERFAKLPKSCVYVRVWGSFGSGQEIAVQVATASVLRDAVINAFQDSISHFEAVGGTWSFDWSIDFLDMRACGFESAAINFIRDLADSLDEITKNFLLSRERFRKALAQEQMQPAFQFAVRIMKRVMESTIPTYEELSDALTDLSDSFLNGQRLSFFSNTFVAMQLYGVVDKDSVRGPVLHDFAGTAPHGSTLIKVCEDGKTVGISQAGSGGQCLLHFCRCQSESVGEQLRHCRPIC